MESREARSGSIDSAGTSMAATYDPSTGASAFGQVDPTSGVGSVVLSTGTLTSSSPGVPDGTPLSDPAAESSFQQAEAAATAAAGLSSDTQGLTDASGDILNLGLAVGTLGGSEELDAATTFFDGTSYSDKVLSQMELSDFHGFPSLVENYSGDGIVSNIIGGDGNTYLQLEIPGSYLGKDGVFQFIKSQNGLINHRTFIPY